MALRSGSYDVYALAGETLVIPFSFYEDDALTEPFDLTGYAIQVVLMVPSWGENAPITLTPGSGLTVVDNPGLVTLVVETAGWPVGRGRWSMQLIDSSRVVSYPLRGYLFVGAP